MCVDVLSACMPVCLVHEGSLEAGRGIGSLGVELQMTMKYQVGAGNQILVFRKSRQCS